MTVQQAHEALLEELLGSGRDGLLFAVSYTTLRKIANIVRLEAHRPLRDLLAEIATQHPDWRVEQEGPHGSVYLTPAEFATQVPDLLSLSSWLVIRSDPSPIPTEKMTIVATLHLADGDLFVLGAPQTGQKTEDAHGQ